MVLSPRVTMTSLRARGIPVSGVASPRASMASASRAMARAPGSSTVIYVLSSPSRSLMRVSIASVTSTGDTSPPARSRAKPLILRLFKGSVIQSTLRFFTKNRF